MQGLGGNTMSKPFFILFSLALSSFSFATPDKVCVRNYIKDPKIHWDPCQHTGTHFYAVPLEEAERKICTRGYVDFFCEQSGGKEYVWIHSPDGKKFCTVDYNQPGVVNYCESASRFYDYVKSN